MRRIARVVVLALVAALPASAAPSKSITLERKVAKKAPVVRPVISPLFTGRAVSIGVMDARGESDPAIVGAQKERGKVLYEWRSTGPVDAAVSGIVEQTLRGWGVSVAANGAADVSLALKLTRYRVDEISETIGSKYRAEVTVHADVLARGGEQIASADASGGDRTSGPDQRAALCNQVLTAALDAALTKIVSGAPIETSREVRVAPAAPPADTTTAAALFADLQRLQAGGVTADVLVAYVKQRKLAEPLTADDILRWKAAGIPQAAIQAALEDR